MYGNIMRTIAYFPITLWLVTLLFGPRAVANPIGGTVAAGNATIQRGAGLVTINQSSDRLIVNWQSFSIRPGEITQFIQPSATAAALNRVISGDPSQIFGTLRANGQVYLINPN